MNVCLTNNELQVIAGALSCYAAKEDLPDYLLKDLEITRYKIKNILKKKQLNDSIVAIK